MCDVNNSPYYFTILLRFSNSSPGSGCCTSLEPNGLKSSCPPSAMPPEHISSLAEKKPERSNYDKHRPAYNSRDQLKSGRTKVPDFRKRFWMVLIPPEGDFSEIPSEQQ
jgi:hypothetical protein